MFTVCPKCALTLAVTAGDLRVAQGYVRCGRCSNVFNALARLSEDRHSAAAAAAKPEAQSAATTPAGRPQYRAPAGTPSQASKPAASGSIPLTSAAAAAPRKPNAAATPEAARAPPSAAPAAPNKPTAAHSSGASTASAGASTAQTHKSSNTASTPAALSAPAAPKLAAAPDLPPTPDPPSASKVLPDGAQIERRLVEDYEVPDDALEFNPDSTDVNKVFVEQPPSPQFTAATGTFNALRLEAEDSARAEAHRGRTSDSGAHAARQEIDPADSQVDVEIDPELLAQMAQLAPPQAPARPAPDAQVATNDPPKPPSARTLAVPSATAKAPTTQSWKDGASRAEPLPLAARAKARAAAAQAAVLPSVPGSRASLAALARAATGDFGRRSAPEKTPALRLDAWWTGGSAALVLLLLVQLVHHYRNDLAATASLNGPLTSLYATLGMPLVPRWNLGAYEVRQLGASTVSQAPGQITVRASVKNAARQPQPLPLLRVTLQDRFGNRIATRDVPPQSYLPRAIPTTRLLSSGQRIDAEMAFVDPGANAVGFEIDACLPAPDGGITCANDAAR